MSYNRSLFVNGVTTFYWVREKRNGLLSVIQVDGEEYKDTGESIISVPGDEQWWDEAAVRKEYDIIAKIDPPTI